MESLRKWYVPQLDGLRFWAFVLVFFYHLPSATLALRQYPLLSTVVTALKGYGWVGVDLFFVLSAFLITTLLIYEREREGRISLKDFYIRRTLRIWPLYYFMLLLGFVVFPAMGLFQAGFESEKYGGMVRAHLLPHLTFLGNYSVGLFGFAPSRALSHMWTISLEEQFYILWPAILVLVGRSGRRLTIVLVGLLFLALLTRFYFSVGQFKHPMIWTNLISRLDPFVLGSGLAIYRARVSGTGRFNILKVAVGILLILAVTRFPNIPSQSIHVTWQYLSVAGGMTFLIDAALCSRGSVVLVLLANRLVVKLGKLGYGLYAFHLIGIFTATQITTGVGLVDPFWNWVTIVFIAFVVTLGLAWVSYQVLEKPFLRIKERFTHIKSRSVQL